MTTAEYLQLPETVVPQELAFGTLRVADSPTASHQRVVRDVALEIAAYLREHFLGELLFAPMDVILDADAALVVQPDLLVISTGRAHLVRDRVYGAPDLVVEVLSPYPRIGSLTERLEWFARYGVTECWVARLHGRELSVLTLDDGVYREKTFRSAERLESRVLPGIGVTPLQIFGW